MQNKQKWNVGDTVYTEPDWESLGFCEAIHGDQGNYPRYVKLQKRHEAIFLKRGCSLVAVAVDPESDTSRHEISFEHCEWYQSFDDALAAMLSCVHTRLIREQDRLVGAMREVQHYRNTMNVAEAEKERNDDNG